MIVLGYMAELVDDDIVPQALGQKCEPVIEVQIPALGAASPPRLLLPYSNRAVLNAVNAAPMHKAGMNMHPKSFYGFFIGLGSPPHARQLNHSPILPGASTNGGGGFSREFVSSRAPSLQSDGCVHA